MLFDAKKVEDLSLKDFKNTKTTFSDLNILAVLFFLDEQMSKKILRFISILPNLTRSKRIIKINAFCNEAVKKGHQLKSCTYVHEQCFAFYFFICVFCPGEELEFVENWHYVLTKRPREEQQMVEISFFSRFARKWVLLFWGYYPEIMASTDAKIKPKTDKLSKIESRWKSQSFEGNSGLH